MIKGPFYLILFLNKNELQSNFLAEINVLTGKKDVMGIEELIIERLKIEGREEGLEQGREQVKAALNYAGTDAFVEYYARAYLRGARPGDTVIVPSTAPPTRKWWEEFVK